MNRQKPTLVLAGTPEEPGTPFAGRQWNGTLMCFDTGHILCECTQEEYVASLAAPLVPLPKSAFAGLDSLTDRGVGMIEVNRKRCYVYEALYERTG